VWIINNQLGRRNLPNFVQIELRVKLEGFLKEKAKGQQGKRTDLFANSRKGNDTTGDTNTPIKPIHVDKEIAKQAAVSTNTVHKARVCIERAPEPVPLNSPASIPGNRPPALPMVVRFRVPSTYDSPQSKTAL
jgi:hypothetical protein